MSQNQNAAEELVHSTCLRAIERRSQFIPETRIEAWLFSVLYSIWISELRYSSLPLGQGYSQKNELLIMDALEIISPDLHFQKIMKLFIALPESQRNAVFLVYVEGFTYQEAALALMTSPKKINSRLTAARAMLAVP